MFFLFSQKQMNANPVHVLTVERAWTDSTILLVFVLAHSLDNVVKVWFYFTKFDCRSFSSDVTAF